MMNPLFKFCVLICLLSVCYPSAGLGQRKSEDKGSSQQYQAVLAIIKSGQLEAASKLLDKYLEMKPHEHRLWLLRRSLAARYAQAGMRDVADQQLEKIVKYTIENPTASKPLLKYLAQILVSISYVQLGQEPRASQILEPAIELMEQASIKYPENVAISSGVSSLINYKARVLTNSDPLATIELYKKELKRLRDRRNKRIEDPSSWFVLAYNLKSAADTIGDGTADSTTLPWRWEHTNILRYGIEAFPDSIDILDAYFSDQLRLIGRYEELELPFTSHLFDQTIQRFDIIFEKSRSKKLLIPIKLRIQKRAQNFRRKFARRLLPGNPMPDLGSISWIQDKRTGSGKLNGPVLLYFDNWRGGKSYDDLKLIANFIDSESNKQKYGLVSILPDAGQTFDWLVAMPKSLELTTDQNQKFIENFKRKFIDQQGIEFSVGLAKDSGKIGEQFGITELPVAAIISSDGTVKKLLTGKGLAESVIQELSQ